MLRFTRSPILLAITLLAVFAIANAQTPQRDNRPRTASISGRVTIAGKAVANAKITVTEIKDSPTPENHGFSIAMPGLNAGEDYSALTDADGRYHVTGLPEGKYQAQALLRACVSEKPATNNSLLESVSLNEGEARENVDFALVRGGVITGRVTDAEGRPLIAGAITLQVVDEEGEKREVRGVPDLMMISDMFQTDDRGVYRIYGLEAGAYVVGVNAASPVFGSLGQMSRELPTYHPSSPRGAAAEINLRGAEEVSGVDIRVRGERGRSISGTVSSGTQGESLVNSVGVRLAGAADKRLAGMTTLIGAQNFSLRGVEDGEYDLSATGFNESMDFSVSAPRRVVVRGADLSGIELKLIKLGSVSGRIVIEAPKAECKTAFDQFKVEETLIELKRDDKTPSLIAPELFATYAGTYLGDTTPDKDGGFTAKNLEAGRYQIGADLPDENWYIRAITQAASPKPMELSRAGVTLKQGEKISGIEMIIAQGAASLSGKLVPSREGAQQPKRLRVHLIPAETADADDLLRYAEAPVRGDGSFEFKHIAPGKYLLHTRQALEKEANDDQSRPLAWDAIERAKLRREASAAKNEIELKVCERVKEHVLRW